MLSPILTKTHRFLASTELAVVLFITIALLAVPGTLLEDRDIIYKNPLFVGLLVLFGLNLGLCTIRRFRSLAKSVLVLHLGIIITLAGCVLTSFGYVATVNIYEGTAVNQAYRWDLQRDEPLGVELGISRINRGYYPVPVKVGVLRGEEKVSLHTLKTGETFPLDGYTIRIDELDFPTEVLRLTVLRGGVAVGTCDTNEKSLLPPEFPYRFKLVAFMNPVLKRLWVDLRVAGQGEAVEGVAEVNHPFMWKGLYFYNTQVDVDAAGNSYAGIQIVRDPGRPVVFAGFLIASIGAVMAFGRKRLWT
jgi:hypothetical protein